MIDLERFHEGDDGYLNELVRVYGPLVLTVARGNSSDLDHADDLFQMTWMRIVQKRATYSGKGRFAAWVRRLAVNVCIGDFRAQKVRAGVMERLEQFERTETTIHVNGNPLANLETEERQVLLHQILTLVPKREQQAIDLRYFEDLPTSEVAQIMGVEKSTVRSLIRKGIQHMRKTVERIEQ